MATHARVSIGKQKGRVRERLVTRPLPPRPEWESTEWWQRQLAQTPLVACARNATHGDCATFTTITHLGRTITRRCPVCGWEQAVLVQEGGLEPCPPSLALPVKVTRTMSEEVKARQQAGRAKSIAIHGIKRRKWEDED